MSAPAARGRRKSRNDAEYPTDRVRANSWDIDDPRARPGRPIGDRSTGYFWAFKEALLSTLDAELERQYREGAGEVDIKLQQKTAHTVLKGALKFLDRQTGDFFASFDAIAEAARVHPNTAKAAIRDLEDLGFIAHVRRSRQKEGSEGQAGPQREQAANAYYFDLQARLPSRLWALFYRTLQANLGRIMAAGRRRAVLILQAFNSKAATAPRPSDATRGPEYLRGITDPAMRATLRRMYDGILKREAAALVSASP